MGLRWTDRAQEDLERLHGYLHSVAPRAAIRAVRLVLAGAKQIARHPRLGPRLVQFDPREVRRLFVGDYEIRYELRDDELFILRVWHVYEDR